MTQESTARFATESYVNQAIKSKARSSAGTTGAILACLILSLVMTGCLGGDDASEPVWPASGNPPFIEVVLPDGNSTTISGTEIALALTLHPPLEQEGKEWVDLLDVLDVLGKGHDGECRFITPVAVTGGGGGNQGKLELFDLVVGRGEGANRATMKLAMASEGEWLETAEFKVEAGDNTFVESASGILERLELDPWLIEITASDIDSGLSPVGNHSIIDLAAMPQVNYQASVLYHADQNLTGNMTGVTLEDVLRNTGLNLTNYTFVRIASVDTAEEIVISMADILNNSQSINPIILVLRWDGKSIPMEDGGPVRLIPPDDETGGLGDFPSHYWWKWVTAIEVVV